MKSKVLLYFVCTIWYKIIANIAGVTEVLFSLHWVRQKMIRKGLV